MGNSNSHSTNQTAHEQQQQQQEQPNNNNSTSPSTNTNRVRFSASLSSLSSFTSKYLFRAHKSYSLSTIDPSASAQPASHQVKIK